MRRIVTLLSSSALFATMALAANWSGSLIDASCHDRQQSSKNAPAESCVATSQTTAFALEAGGKVYKFDNAGNTKTAAALKNRADRTAPGQALTSLTAKVDGSESGGTITVTSIDLQ
ncbi:MAG: hypothetical protein ABIR70_19130 [Bryobacteraceae bacterium]